MLTMDLIDRASEFLKTRVLHTPLEYSPELSDRMGVPVWLKLEFLQWTGSFKLRGAFFRLANLTDEERNLGLVTCSAGNHGKAVAYAARELGIDATIYVPNTVDEAKFRGILALGSKCIKSEFPGYDETQDFAKREAARLGKPFIHAFDDPYVMAGNGGSLAAEVLADLPETRTFLIPVGGGGLGAGFVFFVKERLGRSRIVGCQHRDSPALQLSLKRGAAVTNMPYAETLASGIEGGIGEQTFAVIKDRIDGVALVTETEIFESVRWMLDRHQYLIEPSAAPVIAACLTGKIEIAEGPAVLVLSGRNISLSALKTIL